MVIYRKGSDPVALAKSAEQLRQHASECQAVLSRSGEAFRTLESEWGGEDLRDVIRRWGPIRQQLDHLGTRLTGLAEAVSRNAQAQTDTSAATTGAVAGALSGAAGLQTGSATGANSAASAGVEPPVPYDIDGDGQISQAERDAIFSTWFLKEFMRIDPGPALLHLNDPDFEGIPQGQGYDEGRDEILTTYNGIPWTDEERLERHMEAFKNGPFEDVEDPPDRVVRLSIQDRQTGYETRFVELGGNDDFSAPSKGGGVTTDGEYVWVADTHEIYTYRRSDIDAAGPGETVAPLRVETTDDLNTQNASYITYHDNQLYIGEFDKDTAIPGDSDEGVPMIYRRDVGEDGKIVSAEGGGQRTPNNAQGVAVTDRGLLFSASYGGGYGSPDDLIFQRWADEESFDLVSPDEARKVLDTDNYNEELNIIDDQVYVTHEGGALEYDGEDGDQRIRKYDLDDLKEY